MKDNDSISKVINSIFIYAIIFMVLFLVIATLAKAETFIQVLEDPLKVDEMFVEYRKVQGLRDPYYSKEQNSNWTQVGEFHLQLSALRRVYWNNNFHLRMDQSQVRHVGWEYTMGAKVTDWFHIIKYHHSQHCTECVRPERFPVEDSYGVRVYFKTMD